MTPIPDYAGEGKVEERRESLFVIDIPGGNAKGCQHQATLTSTLTGVQWTISGELAAAISSLLTHTAKEQT